jgi:hypothetical protein
MNKFYHGANMNELELVFCVGVCAVFTLARRVMPLRHCVFRLHRHSLFNKQHEHCIIESFVYRRNEKKGMGHSGEYCTRGGEEREAQTGGGVLCATMYCY